MIRVPLHHASSRLGSSRWPGVRALRSARAWASLRPRRSPSPVIGRSELVTPTPADGATVSGDPPPTISGTYSETLDPAGSSLVLVDFERQDDRDRRRGRCQPADEGDGDRGRSRARSRQVHGKVDDEVRRGRRPRPQDLVVHGRSGRLQPEQRAGAVDGTDAQRPAERQRVRRGDAGRPAARRRRSGPRATRPRRRSRRARAATSILRSSSALAIVLGVAAYLLSRRGRPRPPRDPAPRGPRSGTAVARPSRSPARAGRRARPPARAANTRAGCRWRSTSSGAATTVALSFVFVLVRDVRAERPKMDEPRHLPPRGDPLHAQGARARSAGSGSSPRASSAARATATSRTLFLWVYGWVGVAHGLVPHRTGLAVPRPVLHPARHRGVGPAAARRRRLGAGRLPGRARALAGRSSASSSSSGWSSSSMPAPSTLFIFLVGYTALTLAMMAQFGRDAWRSQRRGRSRSGSGSSAGWRRTPSSTRTVGSGAGLRQRPARGRLARRPTSSSSPSGSARSCSTGCRRRSPGSTCSAYPAFPAKTLELLGVPRPDRGRRAGLVQRFVGRDATAAGLLPIAAGYLIAHYLTYLLIDGQLIVVAISDPLQRGWDLFGTAFYEPDAVMAAAGPRVDASSWRRSSAATCSARGPAMSSATMDAPRRLTTRGGAARGRCRWPS